MCHKEKITCLVLQPWDGLDQEAISFPVTENQGHSLLIALNRCSQTLLTVSVALSFNQYFQAENSGFMSLFFRQKCQGISHKCRVEIKHTNHSGLCYSWHYLEAELLQKKFCPVGKFHIIFNFLFISNQGETENHSMEEKAPQEKCLEMLKHIASTNLPKSVELANNTWYSLCLVELEGWMPLYNITRDPQY